MADKIRLELQGDRISSTVFKKSVNDFFDLIQDIGNRAVGGDQIQWFVNVESGSINVIASPEIQDEIDVQMQNVIDRGINTIERRAERPEHFSDSALKKLRSLASVKQQESSGVRDIKIWTNGTSHDLTERLVKNVKILLDHSYTDYGSIEGRLQLISEKANLKSEVYDDLRDCTIRCYFDSEDTQEVLTAFRKRVSVRGNIKYRRDGTPISIKVEDFTIFRDNSELPTAYDVLGILNG